MTRQRGLFTNTNALPACNRVSFLRPPGPSASLCVGDIADTVGEISFRSAVFVILYIPAQSKRWPDRLYSYLGARQRRIVYGRLGSYATLSRGSRPAMMASRLSSALAPMATRVSRVALPICGSKKVLASPL